MTFLSNLDTLARFLPPSSISLSSSSGATMNNDQFRKLVFANSATPSSSKNAAPGVASPSAGGALGSRQRASIPMTP